MIKDIWGPQSIFRQLLISHLMIVFLSIAGIGGIALFAIRADSFDNLNYYLKLEASSINSILENEKDSIKNSLKKFTNQNPNFWIIIYDKDNKVKCSSIGDHKHIALPSKFTEKSGEVIQTSKLSNYSFFMRFSEVKWHFVVRPHIDKYTNKTIGAIQIGLPLTNFQRSFWESFGILLLLEILMSLLTIYIIYLLSNRIANPIKALSKQTQQITQTGDLTANIPTYSTNEINELADSFNTMIQNLRKEKDFQKEFIANASHELKTPLMAICSATEILASQHNESPELREKFINILERQNTRAKELIDNLLDVSTLENYTTSANPDKQEFELEHILEECIDDMQILAQQSSVELSWYAESNVTSQGDIAQIRQAINNLLINAIKYTPAGGDILLKGTKKNNNIHITVSDTGIGISQKDLKKIFTRFYRTDLTRSRQTGGSGLGLSITKQIIELHNGTISVSSTPNEGTTFEIQLPIEQSTHNNDTI